MGEEKTNIIQDDIEYLIVQNEETKEIIVKITPDNMETIKPYIIRVKPMPKEKQKESIEEIIKEINKKTANDSNLKINF